MSGLPKERCFEAAPFTHCGVDMFGPFIIRERRSSLKRYCVLFTCFASKAVHIEVTCTMDSFTQALRRFMTRRGTVRSIRSDNGTNVVDTDNELRKALEEMNQELIRDYLLQNGTNWITWYKIHLVLHIWVESGSARFQVLEVSLLLYWRPMVTVLMTKDWEHLWLKQRQSLTQDL